MRVGGYNINSGMPLMIFPPVVGKNKRNPKRGCGVTVRQRREWLLCNKQHQRRLYHDSIIGGLRGLSFNVHNEKALMSVTLEYIAELEVWLRSDAALQDPGQPLQVVLSHMLARSPALREAAIVVDELTDIFLDGYNKDFLCDAVLESRAAFSVISTLLTEPYLGGGRAAVQLLDQMGRWMLPDPETVDPRQADLLEGLMKVLARATMGTCLYQANATLAMASILSVLPAEECPRLVAFCGLHLQQLLERPSTIADRGLGRAAALLTIILVDFHDVDAVMEQVADELLHLGEATVMGLPGAEGFGQAAAHQYQHLFVLSSSVFSRMLEVIGATIRECSSSSQVPSSKHINKGSSGCGCHTVLLELLWCLNVCSHSNRPMAENFLRAEGSISALKLATEHFLSDDKQWLCFLALLQLINNIIVWIPYAASQICQSFGSLLCNALQRNITRPATENMKRSALYLAAAFIKTPHLHAAGSTGCVMSDSAVMTGLASALQKA